MQLDPMYPEIALQFLAEARFALGEYELALEAIRKRLERNPESATAHALLASTFGHSDEPRKACAAWEQVSQARPRLFDRTAASRAAVQKSCRFRTSRRRTEEVGPDRLTGRAAPRWPGADQPADARDVGADEGLHADRHLLRRHGGDEGAELVRPTAARRSSGRGRIPPSRGSGRRRRAPRRHSGHRCMHSENLRAEPTASTQCRPCTSSIWRHIASRCRAARRSASRCSRAATSARRVDAERLAGIARPDAMLVADARWQPSSRRNSRTLPSRQKRAQSNGLRKATSESQ